MEEQRGCTMCELQKVLIDRKRETVRFLCGAVDDEHLFLLRDIEDDLATLRGQRRAKPA